MRYVVRTVNWKPERKENVKIIKQKIPELEIFTDTIGDYYKLFFDICDEIDSTGAVVLEDDVLLCKNFKERLELIVLEKGFDKVINFFEKPKVKLETAYIGGSNFLWMQCVYFPPGLPGRFEKYYDEFRKRRPTKWRGNSVDMFVSYVLVKEKIKYWRIRPTLVQHLPFDTAIGRARPKNRQTRYFIDDISTE